MGFSRKPNQNPTKEYLEILNDFAGIGKTPSKMRSQKGGSGGVSVKLVMFFTFLQMTFAIYSSFQLYYMSPPIDLGTKPDFSWATRIARQWKNFIIPADQSQPQMPLAFAQYDREKKFSPTEVCEHERIDFSQKKSNDDVMIKLKTGLYKEILEFQKKTITGGTETLSELMSMKSKWDLKKGTSNNRQPKVTVILNHFKRKTLCAQLNSLLKQKLPFHRVWVLSFGSPNQDTLERIVLSYNDSRISFVGSSYDFKYYGRFQMALQTESDFVYIIDDDMIPGKKMLEILTHVAGTEKYENAVLGSIGRILPFRQKDFTFPSYRKFRSKEAGLYLPDPAYDITVERVVQVDFLSSSWFLSAELVKTLFVESPFTFSTGEDLHLRYVILFRFFFFYCFSILHTI